MFAKFQLYILLSESWQKMKYLCSERSLIWPYQSLYERSLEERTSHYWHNEKHVGQIRIITIPKHIHSNYFPLIFWVISNDILTTTNITIRQKHCRDDIFQNLHGLPAADQHSKRNFMNFQSNPYFKHSLMFATGISGLFCLWDLICWKPAGTNLILEVSTFPDLSKTKNLTIPGNCIVTHSQSFNG